MSNYDEYINGHQAIHAGNIEEYVTADGTSINAESDALGHIRLSLEGENGAVGANKVYSTNSSGVKGWHDFNPSAQTITWTATGDVSGSASGSTAINPTLTVTAIRNAQIPTLSSGLLRYNGTSFAWDSTSYATTSQLSAYLPLTGGTVTGDVTITNDLYLGREGRSQGWAFTDGNMNSQRWMFSREVANADNLLISRRSGDTWTGNFARFNYSDMSTDFYGNMKVHGTMTIGNITTGTQVGILAYDANGKIIQGSASAITNYITSNTDQSDLTGNKVTTGTWTFGPGITISQNLASGGGIALPNNSWIRPTTAGGGISISNSLDNSSTSHSSLTLSTGEARITHGTATNRNSSLTLSNGSAILRAVGSGVNRDNIQLGNNAILINTTGGYGITILPTGLQMTSGNSAGFSVLASGTTHYINDFSHVWDGGITSSTSRYQMNGELHVQTLKLASVPSGTPLYNIGVDANGNVIQGSAGGAGNYITSDTNQNSLSGNKVTSGTWTIGGGINSTVGSFTNYIEVFATANPAIFKSTVASVQDWSFGTSISGNFIIAPTTDLTNPAITIAPLSNQDITFSRNVIGSSATFSGNITAATSPSVGSHLTNKTYVDNLFIGLQNSYITSNSSQTGLSGNKSTTGKWTIGGGVDSTVGSFSNYVEVFATAANAPFKSTVAGVQDWSFGALAAGDFAIAPTGDLTLPVVTMGRGVGSDFAINRNITAPSASFTGNVNATTAPTTGSHLTNKTYVDSAISNLTSSYITTGTDQVGLTGNKSTAGKWTISGGVDSTIGSFSNYVEVFASGANAPFKSTVAGVQDWSFGALAAGDFAIAPTGNLTSPVVTMGRGVGSDFTINRNIVASSATFNGNITAATAPTIGDHLVNKTYVDNLYTGTAGNYITTNTNQNSLSGNKTTTGTWAFNAGITGTTVDITGNIKIGNSEGQPLVSAKSTASNPDMWRAMSLGQGISTNSTTGIPTISTAAYGGAGISFTSDPNQVNVAIWASTTGLQTAGADLTKLAMFKASGSNIYTKTTISDTLTVSNGDGNNPSIIFNGGGTSTGFYYSGSSNTGLKGFLTIAGTDLGGSFQGILSLWTQAGNNWNVWTRRNATALYNDLYIGKQSMNSGPISTAEPYSTVNLMSMLYVASTATFGNSSTNNSAFSNNIWYEPTYNGTSELAVNYVGYQGGNTQFRNLQVYDGKNSPVALFKGSDKSLTLYGPLIGTSLKLSSVNSGTVSSGYWLGLDTNGNLVRNNTPNPFDQNLNTTDSVTFSKVQVTSGGQSLELKPGAVDHTYIAFFARTASAATRSAYMGFAGGADTTFSFDNSLGNFTFNQSVLLTGTTQLRTNGSGGDLWIRANEINSGYVSTSDDYQLALNYRGYQDGTSKFRDVHIYDGKGNTIAFFDGSGRSQTNFGPVTSYATSPGFYVRSDAASAAGARAFTTDLITGSGAATDAMGNVALKYTHNDAYNLSGDLQVWTKDDDNNPNIVANFGHDRITTLYGELKAPSSWFEKNLGNSVGDIATTMSHNYNVGNESYLFNYTIRDSNGSNWQSAGMRIHAAVDNYYMGYIQFNGTGNEGNISFATGNTTSIDGAVKRLIIRNNGGVSIIGDGDVSGSMAVGNTLGSANYSTYVYNNTINAYRSIDIDNYELAINYTGYNGGSSRFRSLQVYDGKQSPIALFTGSDKSTTLYGTLNGTSGRFQKNTTENDSLYDTANVVSITTDGSPAAIGFHRQGNSGIALMHKGASVNDYFTFRTNSGNTGYLWHTSNFNPTYSSSNVVSYGSNPDLSTAQFIAWLNSLGAFQANRSWTGRGSWSYASNLIINDAPERIHIAGSTIEVICGEHATKFTIRITTPTTSDYSGAINKTFIYVANEDTFTGTEYSPGWRVEATQGWVNSNFATVGHNHSGAYWDKALLFNADSNYIDHQGLALNWNNTTSASSPFLYSMITQLQFDSNERRAQMAFNYEWENNETEFWIRSYRNAGGGWRSWRKVWHTGNFDPANYYSVGTKLVTKAGVINPADLNTLVTDSFVGTAYATSNSPAVNGQWYSLVNIRHRGGEGDGNSWGSQISIGMTAYEDRLSFRTQRGDSIPSGQWSAWHHVWHTDNLSPNTYDALYTYPSGWAIDANNQKMNTTGFTYSINAPVTGPIIRLGATSNGGSEYSIQLSGQYYAAQRLFYRTRNGDNGTFGSWLEFWHTGNFDPSTYDNGLFVKKSGDTMTGTLNGTTANFSGNVTAAFFDGSLINRGNYANSTPGTTTGPYGLSLWKVYNNGYPTTYGNLIHVSGDGGGQLLVGWSGVDGADAGVYVRSKRDNSTGAWSAWREFWTTANFNPATYDSGLFVKKSGDTMTGELTIASPIGGTSLRITQDGTNYISFYGNEIRSNTSGNLHINYADVNGSQANRMHTFIYDGSGSAGIIATFNGSNKSSTFSGAVNVEGVLNGTSASLSQGLSAGGHISSSTTSSNVSIDIGGDLNSITNNASYRSSSAANLPSAGNWYYVNTYNHNGNWRLQVAHGYGAGVFPRGIWYRNGGDVPDGTNGWDNWTKVIDSRNLPTSLSDYYGLSAVKYNNETYIYTPTASPSVTIGVAPVSSGAGTQSAIKNIYTIDAAISGTLSSANINISNGVSGASGSLAQALGMLNGVSIGRSFGSGVVSNSGSGDVEKIGTKFVSINLSMTLVSNGAGGAFKSWTVCTFSLPSQLSVQTQALSVHTGSATNIFTAYVSSVANGTCTVYVSGFVSSGNIGETMAYISGLILI